VNSDTEANYGITELECLAVVWAIKLFRPYLYGRRFTLITDHSALKWLMTSPNLTGKLHRWALTLQGLDFEVQYRPGSTNVVADALSRAPVVMVLAAIGRRRRSRARAAARAETSAADSSAAGDELGSPNRHRLAADQTGNQHSEDEDMTTAERGRDDQAKCAAQEDEAAADTPFRSDQQAARQKRRRDHPQVTALTAGPLTRAAKRRVLEAERADAAVAELGQPREERQQDADDGGAASIIGNQGPELGRAGADSAAGRRSEVGTLEKAQKDDHGSRPARVRQSPLGVRGQLGAAQSRAEASRGTSAGEKERQAPQAELHPVGTTARRVGDTPSRLEWPVPAEDSVIWKQRAEEREKRKTRGETLQLADDEIAVEQARSGLVRRMREAASYRGMAVQQRHGLTMVETTAGWRVVLPPGLWAVAFKEHHDSVWAGHLRAPHTYARIAQVYWCPGLQHEMKQ
jgi:hypothetical protein